MSTTIRADKPPTTDDDTPRGPLATFAMALIARHRLTLAAVGLLTLIAALAGIGVADRLSTGGYVDDSFDSVRADAVLADRFGAGSPNLVLVAEADDGVRSAAAAAAGRALTQRLTQRPEVVYALSYWTLSDTDPDAGASLRSPDERTALVLVRLAGDEDTVNQTAHRLIPEFVTDTGPLRVHATGLAPVNDAVERQSSADLTRAELIAAPLTLLILLIAFGSVTAALLPVLVGGVAVLTSLAVLRLLAELTPVSIFALNITTALGFGLAVDYSLFLVTRYREELRAGRDSVTAIVTMVRTAGRTVVFSAVTVLLSFAALLVFPIYFLRSLAYAGIAVVGLSALTSLLLVPPLLALLGHRVDRYDPLRSMRAKASGSRVWHRLSHRVMRRPIAVGTAVSAGLLILAIPFAGADFALLDDRVLPREDPVVVAGELVRQQFPATILAPTSVVLTDLDIDTADGARALSEYARELSAVPGSARVDSAVGSFVDGAPVRGPGLMSLALRGDGATWLSVSADVEPNSSDGARHLRALRAVDAPGEALIGGDAAMLVDTKDMLVSRIPFAALVIVLSMLILVFLFTGSVVLPVKQIALNALSLTASFGAMVYVFQDGHLKWLVGDFVHTGQLEVTVPILMFCIAFGLAMDYSLFLLSRIREAYLRTGDNTEAVAFGMQRTGALISTAAIIVAVVLGAMATSDLSLLKLLGAGLALAVLVDATVVRGLLTPAVMRLLGDRNWWAPAPLRRLHDRLGLSDG
ncbi:MMPL family transporter [Nocardia cyriacigeorgica]|uniref:MMPL family transporter n=1 Tax=Nocardia cyriacigeorgica TaxID=135487 RepID=A0A6P1DG52_9NOCA|nr:MMPL family transporter [Nocardia cyriacigeorgica]NEW47543.1 MMPL family transporter [Nocardia cyriacigeorgica]